MAIGQVRVPYVGGYDFGVGADFATGSPMGKAVDAPATTVEDAAGAIVNFQIKRIQSTEELEEALGIDAEASYGSGSFGPNVSARFSYAKTSKIHSSSLFMCVTAQVELGFVSIDQPVLTPEAQRLTENPIGFTQRYGNAFVRGMARGGLFVGTIRVDTKSSEESRSISAEMQGSYGLFSASAKVKFESLQQRYSTSTFINMYHEGGPIDLQILDFTDPLELLNNANRFIVSFRDEPANVARPYFVTLAPMAVAEGPLPPNTADLEYAQDVLVACTKARSRTLDKINFLEYIINNPERFAFPPTSDLSRLQGKLTEFQDDFDDIAQCASIAIRSPRDAKMPATKAILSPEETPVSKEPIKIIVPSFTACTSWVQCTQIAADAGLVAQQQLTPDAGDAFRVLSVTPPTGVSVSSGAVITIMTQRVKPSFRHIAANAAVFRVRSGALPHS